MMIGLPASWVLRWIDLWGNFRKDIQERLFERAVALGHQGERNEMRREQLAKYLHDHHKRTAGN
jgi:hypothetical protein